MKTYPIIRAIWTIVWNWINEWCEGIFMNNPDFEIAKWIICTRASSSPSTTIDYLFIILTVRRNAEQKTSETFQIIDLQITHPRIQINSSIRKLIINLLIIIISTEHTSLIDYLCHRKSSVDGNTGILLVYRYWLKLDSLVAKCDSSSLNNIIWKSMCVNTECAFNEGC